jgi:hypothetical protein
MDLKVMSLFILLHLFGVVVVYLFVCCFSLFFLLLQEKESKYIVIVKCCSSRTHWIIHVHRLSLLLHSILTAFVHPVTRLLDMVVEVPLSVEVTVISFPDDDIWVEVTYIVVTFGVVVFLVVIVEPNPHITCTSEKQHSKTNTVYAL